MNLKEAFRYQNFLERQMQNTELALRSTDVKTRTTEKHMRSAAHAEGKDETVVVASEHDYEARDVVALMQSIVTERTRLTEAIDDAKRKLVESGVNVDVLTEQNKYMRTAAATMRILLKTGKPCTRVTTGTAYCFNAEGNQTPYAYTIESTTEDLFDRDAVKKNVQDLLEKADADSVVIDTALITTEVAYKTPWSVNMSFEDIMHQVVAERAKTES